MMKFNQVNSFVTGASKEISQDLYKGLWVCRVNDDTLAPDLMRIVVDKTHGMLVAAQKLVKHNYVDMTDAGELDRVKKRCN